MFIYLVVNDINQKKYVGLTKRPVLLRFNEHVCSQKHKTNFSLGRAIKKYGPEHFTVRQIDTATTIEELKNKEIYWIKVLQPEYNMTAGGEGLFGYTHSEETKRKMSATKLANIDTSFYRSEKGKQRAEKMSVEYKERGIRPPPNTHTKLQKWWNNGIKSIRAEHCPDGFTPGRIFWVNR